ncbi:hypothetical protein [uncultured Aliiroseovarius sp.]|uniref:hypothetical protein n=1 Tax=uncultured Aliiroseovarius sp. TaxID=1658783 RepID=UPI002638F0CF|nr:hypothetical protein [uncultured Aliiroseovarius sp.]
MKKLITLAFVFLATQAVAAESWTDREICRAATKTYFWLSDLPADAPDQGDFMGFVSEKKNLYTCRVDGDVAEFKWVNKSSEKMHSRSTKVEISGPSLIVKSDIKTESFRVR